jgi:hypothetical protein
MRLGARLAAGKLTLLSGCSAASRTTDSEYLSLIGFVLLHGGNWKRSTRGSKSSVRQRTLYFWAGARLVSAGVRAECLLRATESALSGALQNLLQKEAVRLSALGERSAPHRQRVTLPLPLWEGVTGRNPF